MRSLIIVVSTVFVLSVGFLVYWWMQSPVKTPVVDPRTNVEIPDRVPDQPGLVDNAEAPWLQSFDPKKGTVASQFRAAHAVPQRDGRYRVNDVEAEFFLSGDQKLRITGRTGVITPGRAPVSGASPLAGKTATGPPTRGELKDVVLTLLDMHEANHPETILTVTMDNASFDNESFKIFTESYSDRKGNVTRGDEVPVHMVGRDYDFDGRGLTIRWNERDHLLELLEIAHGEQLTVKHPGKRFEGGQVAANPGQGAPMTLSSASGDTNAPRATIAQPAFSQPGQPVRLLGLSSRAPSIAVADRGAPDSAQGPNSPATGPEDHGGLDNTHLRPLTTPPLYSATFHDHVVATRGTQMMINANMLVVEFPMESEHGPATQPATAPIRAHEAQSNPMRSGASAAAAPAPEARLAADKAFPATVSTTPAALADTARTRGHGSPTSAPSTSPALATTAPSTEPAEPDEMPLVVKWTGLLRVEPLKGAAAMPPGESMVTFYGSPVVAREGGSELDAGILTYETVSREVNAQPDKNGGFPVFLKTLDSRGESDIHTVSLKFTETAGVGHEAQLRGRGTARLPAQSTDAPARGVAPGARQASRWMTAEWSQDSSFFFTDVADGRSEINRATFDGNVHIIHPQIDLQSDALTLDFDTSGKAPATRPAAQTAAARRSPLDEDVNIANVAAGHSTTQPAAEPAVQNAAMGQPNLKQLEAHGNVRCLLSDGVNQKKLDCDRLNMVTALTPDGRFVPRTLNADGNVHAVDPDQDLHSGHLAVMLATRPATQPAQHAAATEPAAPSPARGLAGQNTALASGAAAPVTRPATLPAGPEGDLAVESVVAHDNVVVITKDGTRATAEQLLVDTLNGRPSLKLLGQPARLTSKRSTLTCGVIGLFPDEQQLSADGPGELHGSQDDGNGATTRPVDVSWSSNFRVDGKANTVDVLGQVSATMVDADGTINLMKGDRVKLLLADAPSTRPATRPATEPAAHPLAAPASPAIGARSSTGDDVDVNASAGAATPAQPTGADATTPHSRRDRADNAAVATRTVPGSADGERHGGGGAAGPTSAPAAPTLTGANDSMDMMGHKIVRQALFQDNAEAHSVLLGPGGIILRRIELYAPTIQYDVLPATQPATQPSADAAQSATQTANAAANAASAGATLNTAWAATAMPATPPVMLKRLTVPCAGEMIVEDHRPTTQPATRPAAGNASATQSAAAVASTATPTAGSTANAAGHAPVPATAKSSENSDRGDNAFKWSQRMTYDEATHQMRMDGDVHVVHAEDGKKEDPITLVADVVIADLASPPSHAPPTTGPAQAAHVPLSKITAIGHVHVVAHEADLTADTVVYDPVTHIMTARGTSSVPAVFSRSVVTEHGYKPLSADEIRWNTITDLPEATHLHGQLLR